MDLPVHSDIIQFDGPTTALILDRLYVTLTSGGVKLEDTPAIAFTTELEAWGRYMTVLSEFIRGAQQIAWRWRPELREDNGAFYVYSRLYAHRFEG